MKDGIEVLRVAEWRSLDRPPGQARRANDPAGWLVHGFGTRTGGMTTIYGREGTEGDLNLGFTADDDPKTVAGNRELFIRAVWGSSAFPRLATLKQVHTSLVWRVKRGDAAAKAGLFERAILKGDGLMTNDPGILLGIQTADCAPVLLADTKRRAVAAFHAGWRGALRRIVEGGVGRMRLEFGSDPADLVAAIGPGIGVCCYRVGEEVREEFVSQFAYGHELFREVYDSDPVREKYPLLFMTARAPGHSDLGPGLHLDLGEANRRQLLAAGLKPESIRHIGGCTACQPRRFFSHRGEHGHTGRMMSVIGVR